MNEIYFLILGAINQQLTLMKNFKKVFIVIFSFVFVFSCSDDDESDVPVIDEIVTDDTKIDGVSGINYDDLTAVSFEGDAEVDENGDFDAEIKPNITEQLPLLFTKNDELLYGYYSKTGPNQTVSIDDILLFYFTIHPEIAIQGFTNTTLLNKIKGNSNYDELTSLTKTSLNANTSPFDNTSFVDLLNASGYDIAVETRAYKHVSGKTLDPLFTFEYTYTRDGKVSWPKEFPLFATVGMEFTNTQGMERKSYLLDKKGLVLSPGSLISWVYEFIIEEPKDDIDSFQLPEEGTYTVAFTNGANNGVGTAALNSEVDIINRFNLAADVISITIPIGGKKSLQSLDEQCKKALIDLFLNLGLAPVKVLIGDKFRLDAFIKDLSNKVYGVINPCIPEANVAFLGLIDGVAKKLNLAEDVSELVFFLRDYLASDITGKETRYFYDNYSFGELTYKNNSAADGVSSKTEFVGAVGSVHNFKAVVGEKTTIYEIERELTSTITPKPGPSKANGLPFTSTITGNATISENSTWFTDSEGLLSTTMTIGEGDSELEIKPAFKNSGIANEVIDLKPTVFNLEGDWIFNYYTGSPVYGVDYLYQQKRFTCDENGSSETSEVRFPWNPQWPGEGQEWLEQGGPVSLNYINGSISGGSFSVIVEDVSASIFYSSNWNTLYTVDDYYWKVKLERQ